MPHLDLPAEIIQLPTLIDLVAGRAPGRTSDQQTSFFLNVGAIGAQFEGVAAAVYTQARERDWGPRSPRTGSCRTSGIRAQCDADERAAHRRGGFLRPPATSRPPLL